MIPWLSGRQPFPPLSAALVEPNGLLAAGADLSVERLLAAYRRGIFPWFTPGEPVLWWSPDPRMVLFPDEFKVSRSLRRRLTRGDFTVRADTAFESVARACAAPRPGAAGTWIDESMIAAYGELHAAGHAHSIETWMIDGEGREILAGGLYGVALGGVFYGESMFTRRTDASKIALARLVDFLAARGFGVIDCQMRTAHLASLGAREIPRAEFAALLDRLVDRPGAPGSWRGEVFA